MDLGTSCFVRLLFVASVCLVVDCRAQCETWHGWCAGVQHLLLNQRINVQHPASLSWKLLQLVNSVLGLVDLGSF